MLIVKGSRVSFDLVDGRKLDAPSESGMMHDPTGTSWPKCSVLVAPFAKGTRVASSKESESYFGSDYQSHQGSVDLPERSLKGWEKVGDLKEVWYRRQGGRFLKPNGRPDDFRHAFHKGLAALFGKKKSAVLYRKGPLFRIEMRRGCVLNFRGFVSP